MLLLPDQVANKWDILCADIEGSLPPIVGSNYSIERILEACLSGVLQIWVVKGKDNGNSGILVTTIHKDQASATNMLLIYAAISYKGGKLDDWKATYETLEKFAKSKGCSGIMGYTSNGVIEKYMRKLGCETENRLIVWRLL